MGNSRKSVYRRNRQKLNTTPPSERILWPALGFPEVIEVSHAIVLLLISDKENLTPQTVAMRLRYRTWSQRVCRWCQGGGGIRSQKEGGFSSDEITITKPKIHKEDDLVQCLDFANLSKWLRDFYADNGLKYLYQITVQPTAQHMLPGAYNLFWVNRELVKDQQDNPGTISNELKFLKDYFVQKRRPDDKWAVGPVPHPPEGEYMSEYGAKPWTQPFVEILHPLFVTEKPLPEMKIAHLGDTHVGIRYDAMEQNSANAASYGYRAGQYNNYNKQTRLGLQRAMKSCDIVVLAGDLIDYGRGHDGDRNAIGRDNAYQLDRNWFLFYTMLSEAYRQLDESNGSPKPIYTMLGNHDWRLHPYGPVSMAFSIARDLNLSKKQVEAMHGPNADAIWYIQADEKENLSLSEYFGRVPIIVANDAVKWYLLVINPFLDFTAKLPGGFGLLVLDWAKVEEVLTGDLNMVGLPIAKDSVSDAQKRLIEHFLAQEDTKAKFVALHATVIGPNPDMEADLMAQGLITCPQCNGTGRSKNNTCGCRKSSLTKEEGGQWKPTYPLGQMPLYSGHIDDAGDPSILAHIPLIGPLFRVPDDVSYNKYLPVHGTIKRKRNWFIREMGKHKVALVLSAHCHRNTAFRLESGGIGLTSQCKLVKDHKEPTGFEGPLYLNTTSMGPVGFRYALSSQPHEPLLPGWTEVAVNSSGKIPRMWKRCHVTLPLVQWSWECWLRKKSRALWVKKHDGGILAGYASKALADNDAEDGHEPYPKGGQHELWIRRTTKAKAVKVTTEGIIGLYQLKKDAQAEKTDDEPWEESGWPIQGTSHRPK